MNFGILLIQGLVNSFGVTVMAAFAAAVKIDSFAYMPVQDFGNAFSTFIAQNYGARQQNRIRQGIRTAVTASICFCIVVSIFVWLFADKLMLMFVKPEDVEIISTGVTYLRVESACYWGIGCLFLLYGLYRGIGPVSYTHLDVYKRQVSFLWRASHSDRNTGTGINNTFPPVTQILSIDPQKAFWPFRNVQTE